MNIKFFYFSSLFQVCHWGAWSRVKRFCDKQRNGNGNFDVFHETLMMKISLLNYFTQLSLKSREMQWFTFSHIMNIMVQLANLIRLIYEVFIVDWIFLKNVSNMSLFGLARV